MKKENIVNFFERLSKECEQSKLTTENITRIVGKSELRDDAKEVILERVARCIKCEMQDLEFEPFVISHFKPGVISLECEACSSIIVASDELEDLID